MASFLIVFIALMTVSQQVETDLDGAASLLAEKIQASSHLAVKTRPIRTVILPLNGDREDYWVLYRAVSDLLWSRVMRMEGFALSDRDSSVKAMADLKINLQKGLLAAESIAKLRERLDCDIVITGYIADLSTVIGINLYLWDAVGGNMFSTAAVQLRKSASIVPLIASPYDAQEELRDYCSLKWRSKPLPYRILAMSVNDIDGDNTSEIVLATESDLKVLSWDGFSFIERSSIKYVDDAQLRRNQRNIRTLVGSDLDGDGCDEIYVSVPDKETLIWKWKENNLVRTDTMPSTLLAENDAHFVFSSLQPDRNHFSGQATYLISKADKSRTDRPFPVDYYAVGIADGKKWLIVDVENRIRVFSDNMEPVWQSAAAFGTGVAIADLDKNGKSEIICTSAVPQGKQDSLIILEWDNGTYSKKWESQPLKGSISALCAGDPNNDGVDELIVAVLEQGRCGIYLYTANYVR